MNEEASPLLAQLQDIHAAANPGWWPPAPGWWLLALALLALGFVVIRKVLDRLAILRRRRRLLNALDALNENVDSSAEPHTYIAEINRLFRIVAIRAFPGASCARLQGKDWVSFISALLPEGEGKASIAALACGPYEPSPKFEADVLSEQTRAWVRRYG